MNSMTLVRLGISSLFVTVVGAAWDARWHTAVGRESFWIPPHLAVYAGIVGAMAVGWYGWYKNRDKMWRRLGSALMLVLLAAPVDDLWHRLFGVEDISSPLVVWSPPHLLLIGAVGGSLIALIRLIKEENDPGAQRLFGGMAGVDAFNIARKGVTLEELVPSQDMTDPQMDGAEIPQYKQDVGSVFKIGNYVSLPIKDIDTIASVIQTTNKGMMV